MIAGMLMFINFATIVDEWVELESLVPAFRNDAISDIHVQSKTRLVTVVNQIFE